MSKNQVPLIRSKLAPPSWISGQIGRDVLLARLNMALKHRLTLIVAPAGYGKTNLLSQWREQLKAQSIATAWLSLEAEDADLATLARYIWSALRDAESETSGRTENPPTPTDIPPRSILSAILNSLDQIQHPVVLILDDLHSVMSPESEDFLHKLIRLAPANCHFVFSSRDHPRLNQTALTLEGQLLEFGLDDLKFSITEAEMLFSGNAFAPLSEDDLSNIFRHTEGWPVALQLASLSLKQGSNRKQLVESFNQPTTNLAHHLFEQALLSLNKEDEEIVSRTALLDHLTASTVNMLCDRQDGLEILTRIERQGMFLTPNSPDRLTYRYHQLFAEYLRTRMERTQIATFKALHHKAAIWFSENRQIGKAVNHAIQTGDQTLIASIIDDAGGWRLFPKGRIDVISQALGLISSEIIRERPRLMLANIYMMIKQGDIADARTHLDTFTADAQHRSFSVDVWNEIRLVDDILSEYENTPITLENLLKREALIRTLSSDDHIMLGHLNESLGAQYLEGGWLERALEPILAARGHHRALGSLYSEVFTHFLEARVRRAQGRLNDALQILEKAKAEIDANFGSHSDLAANCAAYIAELAYEQDRLSNATARLDWALPHMEESDGWFEVYSAAYFTAARISAAKGSLTEAQGILARATRLARRQRLPQLELMASLCQLELLIHYDQDPVATQQHANKIKLLELANDMSQTSPDYRQVAVSASLCRAKILLIEQCAQEALSILNVLRQWASEHGAGRLLIEIGILSSYGYQLSGQEDEARMSFDEAVSMAMFQGIVRPFIDMSRFIHIDSQLHARPGDQIDRFREQFLHTIGKSLAQRKRQDDTNDFLTTSEMQILQYLALGHSNKEIARLTDISPNTIKYRLKSIFRKLGVHKRRDAARVAKERMLT
ncbi:MAG: hypothetical protein COB36_12615 [Alphaproteobacteria bacterium]|nr:MAG: hypothetical protein COB36_12615 [Alphaproteobacteria bacterium]